MQLSAAAGDTGETKKAAQTAFGNQALTIPLFHLGGTVSDRCRPHQVQRFEDAIAQQSSPGSLPTVLLQLDQVQTDASVTIPPRIPTPAQRVRHICAETDVLAALTLPAVDQWRQRPPGWIEYCPSQCRHVPPDLPDGTACIMICCPKTDGSRNALRNL